MKEGDILVSKKSSEKIKIISIYDNRVTYIILSTFMSRVKNNSIRSIEKYYKKN